MRSLHGHHWGARVSDIPIPPPTPERQPVGFMFHTSQQQAEPRCSTEQEKRTDLSPKSWGNRACSYVPFLFLEKEAPDPSFFSSSGQLKMLNSRGGSLPRPSPQPLPQLWPMPGLLPTQPWSSIHTSQLLKTASRAWLPGQGSGYHVCFTFASPPMENRAIP